MANNERYLAACHAMQTGVAAVMEKEPFSKDRGECSPKHLRVGVNSAMCDHAALVRLLIAKGIFTEEEYAVEVTAEMEREVERYRRRIDPEGRVNLI